MVAIPENGRLAELSLPRLLILLHDADFSGCLKLAKHSIQKSFLFASGGAVSASSNLKSDSLGAQLLNAGKISQDDHARLVSLLETEHHPESAALIKLGLADSRELFSALQSQIRDCLLESIGWADGTFVVDAEATPPEGALAFRPDLYPLLQEGIESHWAVERVLGDLEPKLMRFAEANSRFNSTQQQLPSDDAVLEVHRALDGTQTLWKALRQATTPRAMATTWVLDAAGGIDYCDEAAVTEAETPMEIEVVFQDIAAGTPASTTRTAAVAPPTAIREHGDGVSDLGSEISERFEQLDELDYYECLTLNTNASAIDIKKAYLQAAKRYHPDGLARAGLEPELRKRANKIFAKISKAYSTLSNPQRRSEYDASLGANGSPIDTERLANAENLYRKGEILLELGNFKGAVEFLAPAVELWPDEADYQSALGWALYKKIPSEPERSREHLEYAVKLAPEDAIASRRLSFVLRAIGETAQADEWARRAKRLDPGIT
jgi:tetratricopeptide (TPR) repeat protein